MSKLETHCGGTLMGVLWFKEQVTVLRSVSTLLIVIGVAGLYLTGSHQ